MEILIVLSGIATSAIGAKINGQDIVTAAAWGLLGGVGAIAAIMVFYWIIAPSQIHHQYLTRIDNLRRQLEAKNERLAFIRHSLLQIADQIRQFDDAFGTFGPPTRSLQDFGISLIRGSLKRGRTIAREFMQTTHTRVAFENDKQLRYTQRQSVVELERIAESVEDDEILPEFCTKTWLVESLEAHKHQGEMILGDYSENPDVEWPSKRDMWSSDIRRWIEIFVSRDAAHTFMSNIDYNNDRSRLESHIQNLNGIADGLSRALQLNA